MPTNAVTYSSYPGTHDQRIGSCQRADNTLTDPPPGANTSARMARGLLPVTLISLTALVLQTLGASERHINTKLAESVVPEKDDVQLEEKMSPPYQHIKERHAVPILGTDYKQR